MNDHYGIGPRLAKPQNPTDYTSQAILPSSPTPQFYTPSRFIENEEQRSSNISNPWDGKETSEHAQIWHIYNDESSKIDAAVIDGCNRGIDVLLVFTGLFSAVVTTFIIQSYQQMLPDPFATTNALLLQMITDLQNSALLQVNNTKTGVSAPNQANDSPSFGQIRWVNGLWFAALSFSLSAALISMLAKQWIQPLPNISGSPRYRARQRQRWHAQLETWHVFIVINALPVLLHIALLLFFAGVVVLLWSGDIAIVGTTLAIVALSYIFYAGSMWMSLVYPDCPYQHPISEQLRRWVSRRNRLPKPVDLEKTTGESVRPIRRTVMDPTTTSDGDYIDACCFVWLLRQSTNDDTLRRTIQAIGGLPRDFSAFNVLREANAIQMVLQQFRCCFQRDVSFLTQWHVLDPDSASMYCRAWIRLTHGTSQMWPRDLRAPLYTLRDGTESLHVNAIAACASALDSFDSRNSQLALLSHIKRLTDRESSYDEVTESWLLDTFLESSLSWELQVVVVTDMIRRAVPVFLRLLQRATDSSGSKKRQIRIAAILHSLAVANIPVQIREEEKGEMNFLQLIVPSLAAIIHDPDRFNIEGELLEFAIAEFSRLAAPAFVRTGNFPPYVKSIARQGLSKLYLEGRVGVGLVPNPILADILQTLYPPTNIAKDQRPLFVKSLVKTLSNSADMNVAIWAIRLIEPILNDCQDAVVRCFTEENGVQALLRTSRLGDVDDQRLQMECIRTLCVFIRSITERGYIIPTPRNIVDAGKLCPSHLPALEKQIENIFASEFLNTVVSVIAARPWWLKEVADIWAPSLWHLCQMRPKEPIWASVEKVLRNFVDINEGEDGSQHLLDVLDKMREIRTPAESRVLFQ